MGVVFDSSVLIAAERGRIDLGALARESPDEELAIASITASELLHGVHRAKTSGQRSQREAFVEHLLVLLPVLPFDLITARVHARLWADLAAAGRTVGAHDLIIAATALAAGDGVWSCDARSFPHIPGLTLRLLNQRAPTRRRRRRQRS